MADETAVAPAARPRRRVTHIITGLSRGGSETSLYRLIRAMRGSWDPVVISLSDEGFYGEKLRSLGVPVLCCRMRGKGQALPGFIRLVRFLRASRPHVVQSWMYHADLVGGLAARLLGHRAVLWGIRNLNFAAGRESWSARTASWWCARLSRRLPAAIIACSERSAQEHGRRGYARDRMLVIPNGYDCAALRMDRAAGEPVRAAWGVSPEHFLIGMVARWDPLKDHANLFSALERLMGEHDHVRCVLVGPGMEAANRGLGALLGRFALGGRLILAGARDDICEVMNALDLHVLSSRSEAFPNVVAEAMACGTPCVVTDVGEASSIVGERGWCVPPGDSVALYQAMKAAMSALCGGEAQALRAASRDRIVRHFAHERMVAAFEAAWSSAIATRGGSPVPECKLP
jgi:glycosyltransferase involved in cell wall biosynthesis